MEVIKFYLQIKAFILYSHACSLFSTLTHFKIFNPFKVIKKYEKVITFHKFYFFFLVELPLIVPFMPSILIFTNSLVTTIRRRGILALTLPFNPRILIIRNKKIAFKFSIVFLFFLFCFSYPLK